MTPDIPALVADVRALFASLIDPDGGFTQNATIGTAVWNHSAGHAVLVIAQIAAIRVDQRRQALNVDTAPFPRDELLAAMGPPTETVIAAVDLVQSFSTTLPDTALVNDFTIRYGLVGMMALARVANATGDLLVDARDDLGSLTDLLADEALADEGEATAGDGVL